MSTATGITYVSYLFPQVLKLMRRWQQSHSHNEFFRQLLCFKTVYISKDLTDLQLSARNIRFEDYHKIDMSEVVHDMRLYELDEPARRELYDIIAHDVAMCAASALYRKLESK